MAAQRPTPPDPHKVTPGDDARLELSRTIGVFGVLLLIAAVVVRVFYHQPWRLVATLAAGGLLLIVVAGLLFTRVLNRLHRLPGAQKPRPMHTTAPRWGQRTQPVMTPGSPKPRTPAQIIAAKDDRIMVEATIARTAITRWKAIPLPVLGVLMLLFLDAGYRPIGWVLLVAGMLLVLSVEYTRHSAKRDLQRLDAADRADALARQHKKSQRTNSKRKKK